MNLYEYRIHPKNLRRIEVCRPIIDGTAVRREWTLYMRCVSEERAREILAMLAAGAEVTEAVRE